MKTFRPMKAGVRLLAVLEPVAQELKEKCPACGNKVVLWFDHAGKGKRYYPVEEACLVCPWHRSFEEMEESARLTLARNAAKL